VMVASTLDFQNMQDFTMEFCRTITERYVVFGMVHSSLSNSLVYFFMGIWGMLLLLTRDVIR
jgi:hypothetical protein